MADWHDIPEFKGLYQINERGQVLSVRRGKLKHPQTDAGGYLKYCFHVGGKQYNRTIHRLMAEVFIPNPHKYSTVNHKDGNKANNTIVNLEWCSLSQNIQHAFDTGIKNLPRGDKHWLSKSLLQISLDGKVLKLWGSLTEACRTLGYDSKSLWAVANGKNKTAYGFIWKYQTS